MLVSSRIASMFDGVFFNGSRTGEAHAPRRLSVAISAQLSRPVRSLAGLSIGICASLLLCAPALATPIVVNLRVEGSNATLFEGPITTDAESIATASSEGPHACDVKDNGANGGFGASSATATTALRDAAAVTGLPFDAKWSKELNDFFVTTVGSDVNGGEPEYPSWGYAVNDTTAGVGGCQFQLASGSDVLWAYNYFNLAHLLTLDGPASVNVGTPFTVHVGDGQTGQSISGAAIGPLLGGVTMTSASSPTTDANGNASIVLSSTGLETLKATKGDSVRSNGLVTCVHNGNDGSCGTSVQNGPVIGGVGVAPALHTNPVVAKIAGVTNGHVYSHRSAPRILKGIVEVPSGVTLTQVRIRLERRYRGHCSNFNGRRESFVRARRCGVASFFSVGDTMSFSYLLPARLAAGRYVYDIEALDAAGHVTKLLRGVSHVVFNVK
jgi:hypothetical protein